MKKYLITLIGILLISCAIAGGVLLNHEFDIKEISDFTISEKTITNVQTLKLTIDGKEVQIQGNEPDGKYDEDDIIRLFRKYHITNTVTKIELVGVGTWRENKYGDKSFDEIELKSKECIRENSIYDSKVNDCITRETIEEGIE